MGITLYYMPGSGPCQAARMGAKAFGIDLDMKLTDTLAGATRTPEFIKMNPLHSVPTLDDNGLILADSRGILQYFANAYGTPETESLYPKDPRKRAIVDQRFYYDLGILYRAFVEAYYPMFGSATAPTAKDLENLDEKIGFLEIFLSKTAFSAADHLTISDFSIVANVNALDLIGHDLSKFPRVLKYLERCKAEIKDFDEVNADMASFVSVVEEAKKKIKQ